MELKPCPFCGETRNCSISEGFVECHTCDTGAWHSINGDTGKPSSVGPGHGEEYDAIGAWNNAWAHKRIEKLEEEIKQHVARYEALHRRHTDLRFKHGRT